MRIRSVVALARVSERLLSRQVEPGGFGFRWHLVRQVTRALDEREGPHPWHMLSAVVAVGLARLGVVGGGSTADPRPRSSRSVLTGVLDTTRLPRPWRGACDSRNPPGQEAADPRPCARAPAVSRGQP